MLHGDEVAKHNSRNSCWVVIAGKVYDVTHFLDEHPGGANVILKYGGRDATKEYEPIHVPGLLDEHLPPSCHLGPVDLATMPNLDVTTKATVATSNEPPPLHQMIGLADFERVAEQFLSEKGWAYYHSGSDDHLTKRDNKEIYSRILFRPRIFRNVTHVSTRCTLLGTECSLPLFIAPAAMALLAHPDAEAGLCAAAGKEGIVQCVSTNASLPIERIVAAKVRPSQPVWFQLYVRIDRTQSEKLLARVRAAKCSALVLTLDAPWPGKREADERVKNAGALPLGNNQPSQEAKEVQGLGKALFAGTAADIVWDDLEWLRRHWDGPILLKGIHTVEDAALAVKYGVQGIIVSNHGGRALDTSSSSLMSLLEIRKYAPWVFDRIEVYIDGGITRGTHILKALCLGAKAVGLGRAFLYGLTKYGEAGARRVVQILRDELEGDMRILGVTSLDELGPKYLNLKQVEKEIVELDRESLNELQHTRSRL